MFNRLRFTPARPVAVEQRELTCLSWPTQPGIAAVRFNAVQRRRAITVVPAPNPSRFLHGNHRPIYPAQLLSSEGKLPWSIFNAHNGV
jgi:hypothetical protein